MPAVGVVLKPLKSCKRCVQEGGKEKHSQLWEKQIARKSLELSGVRRFPPRAQVLPTQTQAQPRGNRPVRLYTWTQTLTEAEGNPELL